MSAEAPASKISDQDLSASKVDDPETVVTLQKLIAAADQPPRTLVELTAEEIGAACDKVIKVFKAESSLVDIEAPAVIIGDIHGQFADLLRIFEIAKPPPQNKFLFLGDYVDRAEQGIEVCMMLFCYKILFPQNVFMLRGNHECSSISRIYGFYDECRRRYGVRVWQKFCAVFNVLPFAAIISERIFCVHGGISPHLENLDQIRNLRRPTPIPDDGLICDLVWADPEPEITGWAESDRGVSYIFGADVISAFLEKYDFDLLVRAHQVVEDGYEFCAGRQCVTIFSAPQYCGEFDNAAGMLLVNEELVCSFKVLRSRFWK